MHHRMNVVAMDAFEARAAEAERRLAVLEQKGGHASSGQSMSSDRLLYSCREH